MDQTKSNLAPSLPDRQESEQGHGGLGRVPLLQADHDEAGLHLLQARAAGQVSTQRGSFPALTSCLCPGIR